MDKDIKKLLAALKEQGWRVESTRRGRMMAYAPDGVGKVLIDTTIADHHAIKNTISRLKQCGYRPPEG